MGIKQIQESLNQQIDTLIAYRKSLIHECVTGQRRITDEDVGMLRKRAGDSAGQLAAEPSYA